MTTAYLIIKEHSQRVPGKNFRQLGTRPLFRWIVDALLAAEGVERLVIDTDCPELLRRAGLPDDSRLALVERAPQLRGDLVTADALIRADLAVLGEGPVLMSHATSPFLRPQTIGAAITRFAVGDGDSLFSVRRHQARFWTAEGRALNHDPAALRPTQELEAWCEESSGLYLFTAASFRAAGSRIGRRPILFETSAIEALDIDTEDDWALAEVVARGLV